MKSIDIKGKAYVPVNERVKHFHANYANWYINTQVLEVSDAHVLIKASVFDDKGVMRSTGHAYERAVGNINTTSHVENGETSAVGRALGLLGIGIEQAFASSNEVVNAVTAKAAPEFERTCMTCGLVFKTKYEFSQKCYPCYKKDPNTVKNAKA